MQHIFGEFNAQERRDRIQREVNEERLARAYEREARRRKGKPSGGVIIEEITLRDF